MCMKGELTMYIMDGQSCDLRDPSPLPKDYVVAMAYVPFQQYGTVYQPEQALASGTLFPDLDKPFYGKKGGRA